MRNGSLFLTQIALGLSTLLAMVLGDRWLTPAWLALGRQNGIMGFGWVVAIAGLAALVMVIRDPHPRGLSATKAFAITCVVIFPFNFLGALVASGYDGRTDGLAVAFLLFYALQIALLPLSSRARRNGTLAGQLPR